MHSPCPGKMLAHRKETGIATSLYYPRAGLPPTLHYQFPSWPGLLLSHSSFYSLDTECMNLHRVATKLGRVKVKNLEKKLLGY